jgi:hypothetical protein
MQGTKKANVLPEPVFEEATISLPFNAGAMTFS